MSGANTATHGYLDVGDGHQLFFEIRGPDSGPALVFLHGGPGGGTRDEERALLAHYRGRVICLDQRAAGKSRCRDMYHANTTPALIQDLERLREHLRIDTWRVMGGSWGSTLALAYALSHPTRVSSLLIYGVFLCRQQEIEWFYGNGASTLYPDEYARYLDAIDLTAPAPSGRQVLRAFHSALQADDATALPVAQAWARWEAVNSFLEPTEALIAEFTAPDMALRLARLETHYFVNGGFLPADDYLRQHAHTLATIPCDIVQGRYDSICPARSAWDIHCALPQSSIQLLTAAHDASEPAINQALRQRLASYSSD